MMTKPPGFASSSTLPMEDEDEESIDESLDEILLEANERPLENSVKSLEAVPSSLLAADGDGGGDEDDDADVLESSSGATPRRGVVSRTSPPSDITVLAPRPTFADEEVKEETKVDPYETAIRAAATRDDGLTSQASQQRDRALRKSAPVAVRPAARPPVDEVEFEDPDVGGDESAHGSALGDGAHTPADIPIVAEEADSSPAGGYAVGGTGSYMPRLPPPGRPSPPPGRPDIYPARRIPTPSSDFLPGPSPGFGSGSHYPSIAIPAPSAHDHSARTHAALADSRLRLPMAGLAVFLITAFGGGLLVGALLWRGHASSTAADEPLVTHVIPKAAAEPIQPIVVKAVPAPPPVPATATAAVVAPVVPAPAPALQAHAAASGTAPAAPSASAAAAPSMPTLAAETAPSDDAPAVDPAAKPAKRSGAKAKKNTTLDDDLASVAAEPPPSPPRTSGKSKKKTTTWQDPFAQ